MPEYSIPLKGCIVGVSSNDECLFSVRSGDFTAQFEFRALSAQDRHAWVVFLKKLNKSLVEDFGANQNSKAPLPQNQEKIDSSPRASQSQLNCMRIFDDYLKISNQTGKATPKQTFTFKTDAPKTMVIQEDSEENILYGKAQNLNEPNSSLAIRAGTPQKLIEKLTSVEQSIFSNVTFSLAGYIFITHLIV